MKMISGIYTHVRPRLSDDWIAVCESESIILEKSKVFDDLVENGLTSH